MATLQVGKDGKAPSNAKVGDTIKTAGGDYKITGGTAGNWTSTKVTTPTPSGGSSKSSSSSSGSSSGSGLAAWDAWALANPDLVKNTTTTTGGQDYHYENGVRVPNGSDAWTNYVDPYQVNMAIGDGNLANAYYSDALAQLKNQQAAQEEAIRRQTQATIDSINSNIPGINTNYEDQQRANYINYTKNQFGLPDYLRSMGYSGGMSETESTRLAANYQNARNNTDQSKNDAMANIQNLVAQTQATGDTSLAKAASDYYNQYVAIAQQQAQAQAEQERWQKQFDMDQAAKAQNNYLSTIGAYSDDYQAQINSLLNQGYSADSYQVKALQQARNEKLAALAAQQKKDEQQSFENNLALQRLYKSNAGSSAGGTTKNQSYAADYTKVANGSVSPETIKSNMQALIAQYGVPAYNELLDLAEEAYSGQTGTTLGRSGSRP